MNYPRSSLIISSSRFFGCFHGVFSVEVEDVDDKGVILNKLEAFCGTERR